MWPFPNKEKIKNEILDELREQKKQATVVKDAEPWVDIKGAIEDPEHGIKMELDWNDAFVTYLRDNGITGADDEVVVQKWIALLYRDLMEQKQTETGADNAII